MGEVVADASVDVACDKIEVIDNASSDTNEAVSDDSCVGGTTFRAQSSGTTCGEGSMTNDAASSTT